MINESIHSTEVGPAQAGMVTAHFLATTEDPEWLAVLDDVVTLLVPCHNPDGYAITVDWWRQWKGSKEHRGARLPVLYHKYVGHDNNRDWFMLTQAESRVTVEKVHMAWRPQIVVDQHQMGSFGARMFIPPYQEPYEPHVHPLLREGLDRLGRDVIAAMNRENLRGVLCNSIFDAWTPARAFMHYHGAVRVLTEVASCQVADPIENLAPPRRGAARTKSPDNPAPWKGGRWALGDIVTYCSRGALHALAHAARNRETWLRNFHRIHADECAGHRGSDAFLIPHDQPRQSALAKLRDIFNLVGVEVEALSEPALVRGRTWPAGALLIRNRQPYAGFARALLTNTPYPEIRDPRTGSLRRPYDVTSHFLPLLMNLEVHEVPRGSLPSGLATALAPNEAQAPATASAMLLDPRDEGSQVAALRALARGSRVERCREPAGPYPAGALLLRDPPPEARAAVRSAVPAPPDLRGQPLRPQRIGIYGPWLASMDEGWTRFLLDHFEIPFTHLRPADVRAGGLERRIDILVIADIAARNLLHGPSDRRMPQTYLGGLGEVGSAALRTFVRKGGTLITLNSSSDLALQLFDLDIERLPTRNLTDADGTRRRFNLPGCVLVADVDTAAFPAWGCAPRTPIFFSRAGAFRRREPAADRAPCRFPVRYATDDLVAGGYAEGAELPGRTGSPRDRARR